MSGKDSEKTGLPFCLKSNVVIFCGDVNLADCTYVSAPITIQVVHLKSVETHTFLVPWLSRTPIYREKHLSIWWIIKDQGDLPVGHHDFGRCIDDFLHQYIVFCLTDESWTTPKSHNLCQRILYVLVWKAIELKWMFHVLEPNSFLEASCYHFFIGNSSILMCQCLYSLLEISTFIQRVNSGNKKVDVECFTYIQVLLKLFSISFNEINITLLIIAIFISL